MYVVVDKHNYGRQHHLYATVTQSKQLKVGMIIEFVQRLFIRGIENHKYVISIAALDVYQFYRLESQLLIELGLLKNCSMNLYEFLSS